MESSEQIKILVVEDSATQALKLQFALEQDGRFNVAVAGNGADALILLEHFHPAIVISDIVMPGMDGYDLCRSLKSKDEWKDIIVILLTQLRGQDDVVQALQAGADNFLSKPWNEEFLFKRLNYIIANRIHRAQPPTDDIVQVIIADKRIEVNSNPSQTVDLLLSTYEDAIQKNNELQRLHEELSTVNQQLAGKNEELRRLTEEKGRFLRMTAHDLRNPLVNILGYCEFLQTDLSSAATKEQMEFLGIISTTTRQMLAAASDLLDISVIESGRLQLSSQTEELVPLVHRAVELHRQRAAEKQIDIQTSLSHESVIVRVDSRKIAQALDNLMNNALTYSDSGTTITVDLEKRQNEVVVSVSDEGPGIPAEDMDKLFKPYPKMGGNGTETGNGLGLAITRNIIAAHGGKLWAESQTGKGSTFYFRLPLAG